MVTTMNAGVFERGYDRHGSFDLCTLTGARVLLQHQPSVASIDPETGRQNGFGILGEGLTVVLLAPLESSSHLSINATNVLAFSAFRSPLTMIKAQRLFTLRAEFIGDLDVETQNPPVFIGGAPRLTQPRNIVVKPYAPELEEIRSCFIRGVQQGKGDFIAQGLRLIDDAINLENARLLSLKESEN